MGSILKIFPLMALPAIAYALIVAPAGAQGAPAWLAQTAFSTTIDGADLLVTRGHLVTTLAVVCLFFEVLKFSRPTPAALIDNALEALVFVGCLASFLKIPGYGTMEFFLIVLMVAIDFLAGAVLMASAPQRTPNLGHASLGQ